MTKEILLVGQLSASAIEALETVMEAGLTPTNVIWEGEIAEERCRAVIVEKLTPREMNFPAVIVGHHRYPDLEQARIDRRWCGATARMRNELELLGVRNWVNVIHPSAMISPSARLGVGVVVGPGVTVSSHATVGDFVSLGRASSIGHHSSVGDFSRLGPGVIIPGEVSIGSRVVIGPAATFVNGVRITDGVLIGAGSVVTRHVRKPVQIMGNPARPLRRPLALFRRGARNAMLRLIAKLGLYSKARQIYRDGLG